jgi:hypothetical protein
MNKQIFRDIFEKVWVEQNSLTQVDYELIYTHTKDNSNKSILARCLALADYKDDENIPKHIKDMVEKCKKHIDYLENKSDEQLEISDMFRRVVNPVVTNSIQHIDWMNRI